MPITEETGFKNLFFFDKFAPLKTGSVQYNFSCRRFYFVILLVNEMVDFHLGSYTWHY